ncbi:MAG: PilZ domain-containing protein [Phycisphaerales bacterium]|nr:MAG: PilZ domain-containing protein [Phycisphaerales bacterium]
MSGYITNRRRFERFALLPMHAPLSIRLLSDEKFTLDGHAYDISEGGVQFELDRALEPGAGVAIRIDLPEYVTEKIGGPGRSVFAFGNVVWMDDAEAGPVRMALAFTRFAREGDRERLFACFHRGLLSRAA